MATYGRGQMLGSGINPESFKQDYSGMANAAATQAQGVANLGASIGGVIKDFGEQKKEQKKVDAYNKASAKAIEAAITLGNSYKVSGVEDTLSPFLNAYNDPNLSPIEKAALLDEGKAMIPNVFGRFDASKEAAIRMAQLNTRADRTVNLQQGEITETINGQQYKIPTTFNPATGETRRLDGSLVGGGGIDPNTIDNALDFPTADQTPNLEFGVYPDYGSSFDEAMVLPELGDPDAIAAAAELTGGQNDVSNVSPMPPGTPTITETPAIDTLPIAQEGSTPTATPSVAPFRVDGPSTNMAQKPSPVSLPPGATPVGKPQERARFLTDEEKKQFGLDTNKAFAAEFQGNNMVSIPQLVQQGEPTSKFRPATPEESEPFGGMKGQINEKDGRFYPVQESSPVLKVKNLMLAAEFYSKGDKQKALIYATAAGIGGLFGNLTISDLDEYFSGSDLLPNNNDNRPPLNGIFKPEE